MTPNCMIETALNIATDIGAQAYWDGDRCNWLSQTNDIFLGTTLPAAGMCGPNLYDGTAGTALFMAQCYNATFDPIVKRYAEGAMLHALSRLDDLPKQFAFGIYTGRAGVGLAAVRVGTLIDRPDMVATGQAILNELLDQGTRDHCVMDVMVGMGGAIPAVLALIEHLDQDRATDALVRWGDALLATASWTDAGASWDTMGEMKAGFDSLGMQAPAVMKGSCCKPNLLGYAHGTAGIGLALMELAHVTRDHRFHDCATAAMDYEAHWFDTAKQAWPDLRKKDGQGTAPVAWCHGAAGIGMTRLRMWELTGDDQYRQQAELAVSLTRGMIQDSLRPDANWSLCHGVMGNLDLLMMAQTVLGTSEIDTISGALTYGRDTFTLNRRPWVYDTAPPEPLPGLMLGTAGTGYSYLRAADPVAVPSILRIGPSSQTARTHTAHRNMQGQGQGPNEAGSPMPDPTPMGEAKNDRNWDKRPNMGITTLWRSIELI